MLAHLVDLDNQRGHHELLAGIGKPCTWVREIAPCTGLGLGSEVRFRRRLPAANQRQFVVLLPPSYHSGALGRQHN
jgi:hypothetical protein